MNYQRIYNQIIERAQTRQLEGYKEKHHIVPKCLGGSNEKENIVELTAREHFLCHRLLCEIYPKETKLKQALWLMSINKNKKEHQKYKVSSRVYECIKIENNKILGENITIKKTGHECYKKEEWKDKISKALKNIPKTEQHKKNMRKPKGPQSEESLEKRSKIMSKKAVRLGVKNKIINNPKMSIPKYKPILQYGLQENLIKEWPNIKEACLYLNKKHSGISSCLHGKQKTAYGFIWKFKIK